MTRVQAIRAPAPDGPHWQFQSGDRAGTHKDWKVGGQLPALPNRLRRLCIMIKTTKCPLWVAPTHALQIQDDGRPPSWKNKNRYNYINRGLSDFDQIWLEDAVRPILIVLTVKNLKFQKSKMAAAAILKIWIIAITQPRFERFWRNLTQWHSSTLLTVQTATILKNRKCSINGYC